MDHLEGAVDIVVVAVDLDQARVGLDIVHVVIPGAVAFLHNAVLLLGLCLDDHLAVITEGVLCCRQQAVGFGNVVFLPLYHCVGAVEVIIISIHLDQAGICDTNTFVHKVGGAIIVIESGEFFQPYAGLVKDIYFLAGTFMVQCLGNARCHSACVGVGKILLSIHSEPLVLHLFSGPEVMDAVFIRFPGALDQNVVLKGVNMSAERACAIHGSAGRVIEIVILIGAVRTADQTPPLHQLAADGIIEVPVLFKQAGQLSGVYAVFTQVVVILFRFILVSRQFLNSGKGFVVPEVVDIPVKGGPAVFNGAVQRVDVFEVAEGGGKMAAIGMGGIFRLSIRINSVLLLEGGLAGHGIKCICAEINIIGYFARIAQRYAVVLIPVGVILGLKQNAA